MSFIDDAASSANALTNKLERVYRDVEDVRDECRNNEGSELAEDLREPFARSNGLDLSEATEELSEIGDMIRQAHESSSEARKLLNAALAERDIAASNAQTAYERLKNLYGEFDACGSPLLNINIGGDTASARDDMESIVSQFESF